MQFKQSQGFFLLILAAIFTIGLTFASIELPRIVDAFLRQEIDFLDAATGQDELTAYKTDLYLQHYHLRPLGYVCSALIIILVVAGFVTNKSGLSSAGAVMLFLPVFGHFAMTMFFLGGLGFLRLLWLPLLDVSFPLFRLGEIVNLPYEVLAYLCSRAGLHHRPYLAYAFTGAGLFIFFLGTLTWFFARMQKQGVADFWIYRVSRHPQYLGWMVWSYGVMFLPGSDMRLCYELSDSLPWLLSTMIIIGVAMLEEVKMRQKLGERYVSYRRQTAFLFPVPRFLARAFAFPLRLIFNKKYPERRREIVAVLACHALFLLGASAFYGGLVPLPERKEAASEQRAAELARVMREAENFGEKRRAAGELERMGEPAQRALLALLREDQPRVRAYAAGALGSMKSERVISSLAAMLDDQDSYVRQTAAGALGRIGSDQAIQPLAGALQDPVREVASAATLALGQIKHPAVLPLLVKALGDSTRKTTRAAASALGELGAKEAVAPLVRCLQEMPDCPYDVVGQALWKLNSDHAVAAWITGLKKGAWWYPRAFCATALGKNKLEKGIEPLQDALRDSSAEVRRASALALMAFQSERTIVALQRALEDEDFEVRMYAEETLKRIEARGRRR